MKSTQIVNSTDITTLLERWFETKAEITELEKKLEKYKRIANRAMDQQNTDTLSSNYYTLKRKNISRTTISKQDVPNDVWKTYAKTCSYPAYYLSGNK